MCNAQTRSPPAQFFGKTQFNGNQFLCNYTPHIHTWLFKLMEYFDIYDDHDDINYCWLVGASVKGVVKKLHHLQFLIDWLPTAPPLQSTDRPPSQIDTFQTSPKPATASNPTFMPIGNNLFKSDPVRPRVHNFCPKNQMHLIGEAGTRVHNCETWLEF